MSSLHRSLILAVGLGLSLVGPAHAGDIYMGTDANGVITFTDTPSDDEPFEIYLRDLENRPSTWVRVDPRLLKKNLDLWDEEIRRAADLHQVKPELVKAIVLVESGMNPRATSPAGAQGLMQLMPATARSLGVEDSYNPQENILGGTRYIKKQLDRFGDHRLALAAYNAGPGNVRRYGGIPPFEETQLYVKLVMRYFTHFTVERPLSR